MPGEQEVFPGEMWDIFPGGELSYFQSMSSEASKTLWPDIFGGGFKVVLFLHANKRRRTH